MPSTPDSPGASPVTAEVFALFRAGDPAAMRPIVAATFPRLLGFARLFVASREVAEEVAQEAYVALWQQRAQITGAESIRPWLFTFAKRRAIRVSSRRAATNEVAFDADALEHVAPAVDGTQRRGLLDAQARRALEEAINALGPRDRELVSLRYFAGLQHKELADALSMPIGSVGVTLGRALEKLRQHLEGRGLSLEDFLP